MSEALNPVELFRRRMEVDTVGKLLDFINTYGKEDDGAIPKGIVDKYINKAAGLSESRLNLDEVSAEDRQALYAWYFNEIGQTLEEVREINELEYEDKITNQQKALNDLIKNNLPTDMEEVVRLYELIDVMKETLERKYNWWNEKNRSIAFLYELIIALLEKDQEGLNNTF